MKYLYRAYLFIIWTLGIFAAADSTRLTHILFSDLMEGAVYPLDVITQIAMTILRAWSLENLIEIGYNHIAKPLLNRILKKEPTLMEQMRESLYTSLENTVNLLSGQTEENIEMAFQRLIQSNLKPDSKDGDEKLESRLTQYLTLSDSKDLEIKLKDNSKSSWGKTAFCLLGSAIGAISINGFIPPAKDIGKVVADYLNVAENDEVTRDSLENLFAASISICFGALTVYAPYLTFGSLYDWASSKIMRKKTPEPESSAKTNFKALVVFVALLISAGSAIPATELSLTYTSGEVETYIFSSTAFIGLFATDYFPLEKFIKYLYEGKTKKTQLLTVCQKVGELLPKLSDQAIFSLYKQVSQNKDALLTINSGVQMSRSLSNV